MIVDDLIRCANEDGWAVSIRQHPDCQAFWEASITRRITEPHPNGIVREIAYGQGPTPLTALSIAINNADEAERSIPTGLAPDTLLDLPALLNLKPKSTLPPITRR